MDRSEDGTGHLPSRKDNEQAEHSRPVRVAFVLHVMQVAGAEVLVHETIRRLGHRIVPHVYCLDAIGQLGHQLIQSGVPVVSFDRQPGLDRAMFGRIATALKADAIDVIHAHQYTPFFYSAIAARLAGTGARVVFTEHGRHFPDVVSWKRRWTNRLVLRHFADAITAVCDFSARALVEKDGFPAGSITTIPNGIDFSRYRDVEERGAIRQRLGLQADRRYVTIVARFHPVKDHATLLRAFSLVARQLSDVDLLLVGDGPERGNLEAQARALDLEGRIHFVGIQRNVPEWLHASDVFVLSSVSEAASITLLEAMACARPVVVTAVGGNPELVREGQDGYLVPRGDAAAMADRLALLLQDPERASAMGRSGRTRVLDEFQIETTISRYGELFADLARTRRPRSTP